MKMQMGVVLVAACVVVLVPIGMAGWHLSRNRMLFFSGALFITLAVGVHLSPYLPPGPFSMDLISISLSSSSSVVLEQNLPSSSSSPSSSCISLLHEIEWYDKNSSHREWGWSRSPRVEACDFQKLSPSDASDLLNGSRVTVAGDSQARLLALSLLSLVLNGNNDGNGNGIGIELIRGDLFKRHSDYHIHIPRIGMTLDFIWAPFVRNVTELNESDMDDVDVLVMGCGLWDMLHVHNASDYGLSLQHLLAEIRRKGRGGGGSGHPHLFWLGMPSLINSMLNTQEKKDRLNDETFLAYEMELQRSKLLQQSGGGPLLLLDIHSLTQNCGPQCTQDGMHYDECVYDAAVHVLLNALLIQSLQKI